MTIKKVVVIDAGTMVGGIAQLCAQQGFDVVVTEVEQAFSDQAVSHMKKGLSKRVEKGKITEEEQTAVLSRVTAAEGLSLASDADIVIESVIEDLEIKKNVFSELDKLTRPDIILVTNTTSLSISAIA